MTGSGGSGLISCRSLNKPIAYWHYVTEGLGTVEKDMQHGIKVALHG